MSFGNIRRQRLVPRYVEALRPHEPMAPSQNLKRESDERKGVIRKGAKGEFPVTAVSNLEYNARLECKVCRRCFSYTFLEVRRETREGKYPSPGDGEGANTEG